MEPRFTYRNMVKLVRNSVYTTVRDYYPSKANHEKMSLYDLMTFAVMAHISFDGVYKKAYKVFIDELKLFPRVSIIRLLRGLIGMRSFSLNASNSLSLITLGLLIQSLLRLRGLLDMGGIRRGVSLL